MSVHNSQPERAQSWAHRRRGTLHLLGEIEVLFGYWTMIAMAATDFLVFP